MHKLSMLAVVLLGTAASTVAQTCATPSPARTFSNREEFGASFYYNIGNHFADVVLQRNISISGMSTWTYDSGIGNPPTPNQVGAQGVVRVYTCPTTRLGNEAISPTAPGSPWTLVGAGTITIVATPGESPIVFNPPLFIPAGTYGLAVEYLATTNGPNPGPLHCLGVSPNPTQPVSDQFITWSNDGIQGVSWTGGTGGSPNLRITYTPDASAAHWNKVGAGCYFRPYAFYESFPASATPPDVANTSLTWIYTGTNYVVLPGAAAFIPSASPNLTAGPFGSSSSAPASNWDDALTAPIVLPFTLNYPGGSTNDITISSNGCVYLASVIDNSYDVCGAAYGSIVPFRDEAPRIACYFMDLDPDPVTGSGSIHYDVDPNNAFVRITWNAVPEWPVPTALNTIQLTIYASGTLELVLGNLANTGVGNGNNALLGFTPGLGSMLPPPIDLSASMPYTSGDGAIPSILALDARPVIGTQFNLVTSNIGPALISLLSLGDTLAPFPLDLGFLGMPGCSLHHNAPLLLTNIAVGGVFTQPFNVPNNPGLLNVQLTSQAFPLSPGFNAFGFVASNAVCMRIGN